MNPECYFGHLPMADTVNSVKNGCLAVWSWMWLNMKAKNSLPCVLSARKPAYLNPVGANLLG